MTQNIYEIIGIYDIENSAGKFTALLLHEQLLNLPGSNMERMSIQPLHQNHGEVLSLFASAVFVYLLQT